MRKIIVILVFAFCAVAAHAAVDTTPAESWTIGGKTYDTKGAAVRAVIASGKRQTIMHSRCEILTNKLSFKACPKNKVGTFENEQFDGLKQN